MKLLIMTLLFSSCAVVHHVQVGEIAHIKNHVRIPFEVKVSETAFDFAAAADLGSSLVSNENNAKNLGTLSDVIQMFQFGPKTGGPVYNDTYADKVIYGIYEKCPSGNVTGLTLVREMTKYPIVSGEIVKITGYCLEKKTARKSKRKRKSREG